MKFKLIIYLSLIIQLSSASFNNDKSSLERTFTTEDGGRTPVISLDPLFNSLFTPTAIRTLSMLGITVNIINLIGVILGGILYFPLSSSGYTSGLDFIFTPQEVFNMVIRISTILSFLIIGLAVTNPIHGGFGSLLSTPLDELFAFAISSKGIGAFIGRGLILALFQVAGWGPSH